MTNKVKCTFGFHAWEKLMGLQNMGNGKFRQRYVCKICKKTKEEIK